MKCKVFEHHLPDWIGERLPYALAQQMQAHHAACSACQKTANVERALRARWQELPPPSVNTALWSRLAQRIETAPPQRSRPLLPVWAMSGAMVMVVICSVMWTHAPTQRAEPTDAIMMAPAANPVDEHHIVQMVSEVQQLSEGESDNFFAETQQDRQAEQLLIRNKGAIR